MHPPLFRPHPKCEDIVKALVQCHNEKYIGKWFGACNQLKYQLDDCFFQEKEMKRKINLQKARAFDAKFEEYERLQEEREEREQAALEAASKKLTGTSSK